MVARSGPAEHPRHACAPTAAPSDSTDLDPISPDSTGRETTPPTCPPPHHNPPIGSVINVLGAAPAPYGLAMPDTAPLEDVAPQSMLRARAEGEADKRAQAEKQEAEKAAEGVGA